MSTTISGTNGVTFPDSTSMQTGQQACKAWVNFNGTGAVAIRGSYNVSSITDNGTGIYTMNFSTAMPNTNYSFQSGYGDGTTSGTVLVRCTASYFLTGSLRIDTVSTTAFQDVGVVCIGIFS